MVKLKTILDIRRAKSDGTYPIMFRVTNHKEVKYIPYGISVLKQQWDEKTSTLKKNHPNASTLNTQISKRYYEIQKAIARLEDEYSYSFDSLQTLLSLQVRKQPAKPIVEPTVINLEAVLQQAFLIKLNSNLSKKYKRNLQDLQRQLLSFFTSNELKGSITDIPAIRLDEFLTRFSTSGTYYMNKRRELSVIFNLAGKIINKPLTAVKTTERKKAKAALHVAYEPEQLKPILSHLKTINPSLYLCCLLTYATWLRPHEEVRLLTKGDFVKDFTEIHLSGEENKGGKVRTVYVPDYVRAEIEPKLINLQRQDNIFTGMPKPLNQYYFSTQWKRASYTMLKKKLIYPKQTLYSFRHTAAVQLYRRTKDVYLLQKLLGHSTIVVTLKYLRSLGELNSEELKNAAPQL